MSRIPLYMTGKVASFCLPQIDSRTINDFNLSLQNDEEIEKKTYPMETKATALLLSIAMTLSLLSGCGGMSTDIPGKNLTLFSAITSVGSGALSVGMGGVLVIDKMLTAFAEEAASTKLEDIAYVFIITITKVFPASVIRR